MSQYFEVGEQTLWNPSNGPGRLFVSMAKALEPVAGLPSGIGVGRWGSGDPDCHGIDLAAFTTFTDALARRYRESNHLIMRSLMEGFIATAIVLVERGGGTVPALTEQPETSTEDVQIGLGGPAAQAAPDRLAELAGQHSSAMAW